MTHALIIGGSIAGTVAAMALQKAGITSVIYEAYPTGADDAGAWLTVMVNGMDALKAIDAHEPVINNSFPTNRVELFSGTGKRLGEMRIDGEQGNTPGPRNLKRAGLCRVLGDEAARRGIGIQNGKRLIDATIAADGRITASFADGTQAEGDLLIGADGIHSATRAIIDRAAPRPCYTGLNSAFGYTANSPVAATPDTLTMIYGRRAFFGYVTTPSGEIWWFANSSGPELSKAELAATTVKEWQHRLLDLFAGDHTPAADIIRATEDIIGSNIYDISTTSSWFREQMIIVGDAAHAISPSLAQGASMAIEDSVVLAKSLRDLPTTHQAFRAYEQLRRKRVERVAATAARMGNMQVLGFVKRVVRDATMPRMLRRGPNITTLLSKHHIDWDDPVAPFQSPAAAPPPR